MRVYGTGQRTYLYMRCRYSLPSSASQPRELRTRPRVQKMVFISKFSKSMKRRLGLLLRRPFFGSETVTA